MGDLLSWVLAHGGELLAGLIALNAGLAAIARLTPTKRDDHWAEVAQSWLERGLALFLKAPKAKPPAGPKPAR